MEAVCNGHDVFVWLPTGYGKSLCYQVQALAQRDLILRLRLDPAHLITSRNIYCFNYAHAQTACTGPSPRVEGLGTRLVLQVHCAKGFTRLWHYNHCYVLLACNNTPFTFIQQTEYDHPSMSLLFPLFLFHNSPTYLYTTVQVLICHWELFCYYATSICHVFVTDGFHKYAIHDRVQNNHKVSKWYIWSLTIIIGTYVCTYIYKYSKKLNV